MASVCFHGFIKGCIELHNTLAIHVKDVNGWLVPRALWALLTASPDYTSLAAFVDRAVNLKTVLQRLCEEKDTSIVLKALDAVYEALPTVLVEAYTLSFTNSMGSLRPFAGLEANICRDNICWLKVSISNTGEVEVNEVSRLTRVTEPKTSCKIIGDKAQVSLLVNKIKYDVELSYKPLDEVEVAAWVIVAAVKALPTAVLGWPGLATDVLYVPAGRSSIAALAPIILGQSLSAQVPMLTLAPNPERNFITLLFRAGVRVSPEHSERLALLRELLGYEFSIEGLPGVKRKGSKVKTLIANAPRGLAEVVTIAKLLALPSKPPMVIVEEPGEGLPEDKALKAIRVLVEGLKGEVQKLMFVTSSSVAAKELSKLVDRLYVVEDGVIAG